MNSYIYYTGIGSDNKPTNCIYNHKDFITIINKNKHLFYFESGDESLPIVNPNKFKIKELKKLVDICGAEFITK